MDKASTPVYEFGEFRLDSNAQRLVGPGGEALALPSRAFDTLHYLVERSGQVVGKSELMDAVWPTTVVSDNNLNQCILQLRKVLGESAGDRRFILTVPGRGFKFVAPVTVLPRESLQSLHPPAPTPLDPGVGRDTPAHGPRRWLLAIGAGACVTLIALAALWFARANRGAVTSPAEYQALTDVADSATAPVLSPDGRLLAFIRNGEWLLGSGQVWLKPLPDGESVQLTRATGLLFAPAFTSDGTRVSYTVVDRRGESWDTWTVPVTGGEPTRLLPNASGLTWIGPHEAMYSEFRAGVHLGVVESQDTRAGHRDIYWPAHERAMAHFSWLSPDRRDVLVAEMDGTGSFRRCRLVPFDGGSDGTLVGPANGACVSAAWSIDGRWMYFSARVAGRSHLWRQRYPDGEAEQITFGPTEEETVFAAPDGRSLLTSIGTGQDALWLHARTGERALTTEGSAFRPWLSGDARRAYFLSADNVASAVLLTRIDVATGRREALLPAMSASDFDVDPEERQVVLTVRRDGIPDVWIAPLDRHAAPRLLVHAADQPRFGGGRVYFRRLGGKSDYLHRIDPDGTHESRVLASPIVNFDAVAPDGRFAAVDRPVAGGVAASWLASTQGEGEHMIGRGWFPSRWSLDGKWLFLEIGLASDSTTPGRTAALRLDARGLPAFPVLPLPANTQVVARPEEGLSFGPDPSVYVFTRSEGRRNIYRIPLH